MTVDEALEKIQDLVGLPVNIRSILSSFADTYYEEGYEAAEIKHGIDRR